MFEDKFIYTMRTILHNFIKSIETNQKLEGRSYCLQGICGKEKGHDRHACSGQFKFMFFDQKSF